MSVPTTASALPPEAGLFLAAAVHLWWTGLIAGSSTAASAIDALGGARLRAAAARVAPLGRPGLLSAAWLLVTATGVLIVARIVHPRFEQTGAFWAGVLLPLAAGLGAAGSYRSLLRDGRWTGFRPVVGLAGVGLVVASCLLLIAGSGTLLQPESWFMAEPPWRFLPTWSGMGRFGEFTLVSLAAAGVRIAALGTDDLPPDEARFLRRFGGRFALVFLLAWGPAALFTLFNLPDVALGPGVWGATALGVLAAGGAAWVLSARLVGDRPVDGRPLAVALLVLLASVVLGEQIARANALRPEVLAGLAPAPAVVHRPAPTPAAGSEAGPVAAGKAVFDRVCSLCHRFDVRKVGPPFDVVVPKYRKDPAGLKAFIRAPVRKDPAYPPMPKPAVTDAEIDAVTAFLLERGAR